MKGAGLEKFEWDEAKVSQVLAKHGIDLIRAAQLFDDDHIVRPAKSDGELRYQAIGPLDGKLISLIFTYRGENIRLITARRARQDESRAYYNDVDGRDQSADRQR